ncbi:uncharacterized protein LOC133368050 [Rhineura floridana]|uniref:uncharacterized protein LOC133368050 n=1 Tax=Rhineura floridana TaxID=261503 RepID=UPI002AC86922|nr:uncharacterized protein LOC133368050 [Rhineura floridana]
MVIQEQAKFRKAAFQCYQDLLKHPEYREDQNQIIRDLTMVLVHVEDEDKDVAEVAKNIVQHLLEALQWHPGGRPLVGDPYSLQELLHKITKHLIRHHSSERDLEALAYNSFTHVSSKQASVRRIAAMFIGHLLHKKGSILTEGNICVYHAWLENHLSDHDPAVRRVAHETQNILRRVFCLYSRHGLQTAIRCLVVGCKRQRYPPEHNNISA